MTKYTREELIEIATAACNGDRSRVFRVDNLPDRIYFGTYCGTYYVDADGDVWSADRAPVGPFLVFRSVTRSRREIDERAKQCQSQ